MYTQFYSFVLEQLYYQLGSWHLSGHHSLMTSFMPARTRNWQNHITWLTPTFIMHSPISQVISVKKLTKWQRFRHWKHLADHVVYIDNGWLIVPGVHPSSTWTFYLENKNAFFLFLFSLFIFLFLYLALSSLLSRALFLSRLTLNMTSWVDGMVCFQLVWFHCLEICIEFNALYLNEDNV